MGFFGLFFSSLPAYGLGGVALAPGLLNLWLLWFSYSNGLPIERENWIFALNGVAMSAGLAALIFVPVAHRWFLMRRETWPAEAFFWQLRIIFAVYVVFRFIKKFEVVPLPEDFEFLMPDGLAVALGIFFALTTVIPGLYSRRLLREAKAKDLLDQARMGLVQAVPDNRRAGQVSRLDARREMAARLGSNYSPIAHEPISTGEPVVTRKGEDAKPRSEILSKLFWYGLGAPLILLALLTIRGFSFVPKGSLVTAFEEWRLTMTVGLAVFLVFTVRVILPSHAAKWSFFRSHPLFHYVFGIAFVSGAFHVFAPSILTIGTPMIHSVITDERSSASTDVIVTGIGKRGSRRSCDYSVYATGIEYIGPDAIKICGVDPDDWQFVRVGDRIRLEGFGTEYGLKYRTVRLLR